MGEVATDEISRLPERYRKRAKAIAERVGQIDNVCRPATTEEIGTELKRLRNQLRPQPETDVTSMAEGFKSACRDLPAWAISEAANDFLCGRVESHTGQFMPTCAEFAKRARSILIPFLAERSALKSEAEKMVERALDEQRRHLIEMERKDPASRARVAAIMDDAFKGYAKVKALPHVGLDAEAQKRIDALKKPRQHVSKIAETKLVRGR